MVNGIMGMQMFDLSALSSHNFTSASSKMRDKIL